ncbi:energy transducer TonB [Polynucleobacter sp. MG-27-Goln-C1]|uniref:energy transducer TonB n=1 Tax=Polynucleobacter sp. MG-27-Goln-C1 TaxID=1819726 RepID=UPI001C0E400E|nr:energy transducer TonB [Polynucleobacter sp. MG-27-Goln-C1]MBU3612055.1 energy transducer TonB [Polynucleobacter sp. MG-27-Goln-C1]
MSTSKLIPLWVIGVHISIIFGMGIFQERTPQTFMPDRLTLSLKGSLDRPTISKVSESTKDINVANSYLVSTIAKDSSHHESAASSPTSKTLRDRDIFLNPKPIYPLLSRRMREQGAVQLKLCINEQGNVESVLLAKSSGHEKLDRSAMDGVRGWKFSALESGEQALSHCYHLPIHFRLET